MRPETVFGVFLFYAMAGSLHCLFMCGPVALAVPFEKTRPLRFLQQFLTFHLGRILIYTLMGAICGFMGRLIQWGIGPGVLSVITGIIIFLTLVAGIYGKNLNLGKNLESTVLVSLQKGWRDFLENKRLLSLFILGMLNAFLPCGFLITVLLAATGLQDPLLSSGALFFFGLGTTPILTVPLIFKPWLRHPFLRKLGFFPVLLGSLLSFVMVYRGIVIHQANERAAKSENPAQEIICPVM